MWCFSTNIDRGVTQRGTCLREEGFPFSIGLTFFRETQGHRSVHLPTLIFPFPRSGSPFCINFVDEVAVYTRRWHWRRCYDTIERLFDLPWRFVFVSFFYLLIYLSSWISFSWEIFCFFPKPVMPQNSSACVLKFQVRRNPMTTIWRIRVNHRIQLTDHPLAFWLLHHHWHILEMSHYVILHNHHP